ncbi:MAG: hypothetical protein IBX67_00310 [Dehalococcoidia bacterium]|nr:hypothetical protein [Dehalococcoidia bacterium]
MPRKLFDDFGRPKKAPAFTGRIYSKMQVSPGDMPWRLETGTFLVLDAYFKTEDYGLFMGNYDIQVQYLPPNSLFHLFYLDLSELYFVNSTPGQNGRVIVVASLP